MGQGRQGGKEDCRAAHTGSLASLGRAQAQRAVVFGAHWVPSPRGGPSLGAPVGEEEGEIPSATRLPSLSTFFEIAKVWRLGC